MDICPYSSVQCLMEKSQLLQSSKTCDDHKNYIEFNNVRIYPKRMEFQGAYEGKHYKTKIMFQNVGKSIALVRMSCPTSYAYRVKCFPRGIHLSPGLSIERVVEVTYTQVCVQMCILPIYVNEERLDYELEVILSSSNIQIIPSSIDFGCIDAGSTSLPKFVDIRNIGTKSARFSFDLVGGKHELIIEPVKGHIAPKQTVKVSIRLLTYDEGIINTEIWIRSDTPRMIAIQGLVIVAKFEAIHPNTTSMFTVLDFPMIYHKSSYTKNLLIRNYSSSRSIFCVLAELRDGRLMGLEAAGEIYKSHKFFNIIPSEGRFEPKETKLFQITFQPRRLKDTSRKFKGHYAIAIQIRKVNFRDILSTDEIFESTSSLSTGTNNVERYSVVADAVGGRSIAECPNMRSSSSSKNLDIVMRTGSQDRSFLRIYLLGQAEDPSVTVTPDKFVLLEHKVNTKITRVLELKNNSRILPIILLYKKVAYIELERNVFLKPLESKQIPVVIAHPCIGLLNTQITFDLLHYDRPKTEGNYKIVGNVSVPVTLESIAIVRHPIPIVNPGLRPNYIKEVGIYCEKVKYSDIMNKPKMTMLDAGRKTDDLVAFPNDRPSSLRPWRSSKPCTTICSRQRRYIPPLDQTYEVSIFDREFRREIAAYYTSYQRREAERLRSLQKTPMKLIADEYAFAETFKVNFNNVPTLCGMVKSNPKAVRGDCFMPLSPIELNMISVSPAVIQTGEIACYNGYNTALTITNRNNLSIRLYLKPDKPNVLFPQSNRRTIAPNSENQIEMVYTASAPGYYVVTVDILVNESSLTQVIILADVIIHSLRLSKQTVYITDESNQEYIEVVNSLNVPINYIFDVPFLNFCIEPCTGLIKPNSSLTCVLTYYTHISGPNIVDLEFISGDKDVQFLKVICELPNLKIDLITQSVRFGHIPLNIGVTKSIFFRNPLRQAISFAILETPFDDDWDIYPRDGTILGRQLTQITISAKFQNCFAFRTNLQLDVTRMGVFDIPVSGTVVYPTLRIVPESLQFRTVPFSSTDTIKMNVTNKSAATVTFQINFDDYQDYKVTEESYHWASAITDEMSIDPGVTKSLFVHYMPTECAISLLYLPLIINGILGPPIISDQITVKVDYYLKTQYKSTQLLPVPTTLHPVKITGLSKSGKVSFSKLTIDFAMGIRDRRYKTKYQLKITNCQKEPEDVCIRTDQLEENPFVLTPASDNIEEHMNSVVCFLKEGRSAEILIEFQPEKYGFYNCFLPVYLRSDLSTKFHNVIELKGIYTSPTISGERLTFTLPQAGNARDAKVKQRHARKKVVFYSRPIPLKIAACSTKKYAFREHFSNCVIITWTNLQGLSIQVQYDTMRKLNDNDYDVEVVFRYSAEENTQFSSNVEISCSCGGLWDATLVGCAENCFLTSYAFSETFLPEHLECMNDAKKGFAMDLDASSIFQTRASLMSTISRRDVGHLTPKEFLTMEFFSSYPFFPVEVTPLLFFLERCLLCVESWICNQIFFQTIRYQIPETITYVRLPGESSLLMMKSKHKCNKNTTVSKRNSDILFVPPYADILINSVGADRMIKYLQLGPKPSTAEATCRYLYCVYENAIKFIRSLGAYFVFLEPEYLLDYDTFLLFKKYILPNLNTQVSSLTMSVKNRQEFYYLSKQAWLDLLLQTYKVLHLYRLNELLISDGGLNSRPDTHPMESFKKSVKNFTKNANIFSNSELVLINWLEFHYTNSKAEIWPDNKDLQKRDVNFFGENLQDGIVFAAVTGTYCPYLIPKFRTMFTDTDVIEELIHNNCVVIRAWKMLNFSVDVKPEDIIDPNSVHMLMLITYLFEILPSMYPIDVIDFQAGLSQSICNCVSLRNPNTFPISYKVIFFGNEMKYFSCDRYFYVIQPGQNCKIRIHYHARHAKKTTSTLLLSGENEGYRYAKNRVLTLNGLPDVTYMSSTITYPVYLYRASDVSFSVKSPYSKPATTYDMQIVYKMVTNAEELETIPLVNKAPMLNLSKLTASQQQGKFDDHGVFNFEGTCSAVVMEDQEVCIYFRNKDVGDFGIRLVIEVKPSNLKELINVILPTNFIDLWYTKPKKASEYLFIEIPSQNMLLWNAIKDAMLKSTEGDVLQFWKKNIGTTMGMQIMQQMVLGTEIDINSEICDSSAYAVKIDRSCDAILPETLTIEDECSSDSVRIPFRLKTYRSLPKNFDFSLESIDSKLYRRYYEVSFVYKQI